MFQVSGGSYSSNKSKYNSSKLNIQICKRMTILLNMYDDDEKEIYVVVRFIVNSWVKPIRRSMTNKVSKELVKGCLFLEDQT